jgi:hypothetical protein
MIGQTDGRVTANRGNARRDDATSTALSADSGDLTSLPQFQPALERLTVALEQEAALTQAGWRACWRALHAAAEAQRGLVEGTPAGPPEPGQPDAQHHTPTIFITGLHRTGTTLLQSLLAQHPGLYAPRLWELMHPTGGDDQDGRRALVRRTRDYVDEYYRAAPGFRAIHPLGALRPEECHRLIGMTFLSEIYTLRYNVPGYLEWLDSQDHRPAYRFHLRALRAMAGRAGTSARPAVLKCPFHLWHAHALARVYPRARVVRLHRDPLRTIASISSLTLAVRRARSDRVSPTAIGADWLERTRTAVAAMTSSPADAGFGGLPVLDLPYSELTRDPLAAAARVCEFADVAVTHSAEARMRRFLGRQAAEEHGRHSYRLEDFGLSGERLGREFAEYRTRFRLDGYAS